MWAAKYLKEHLQHSVLVRISPRDTGQRDVRCYMLLELSHRLTALKCTLCPSHCAPQTLLAGTAGWGRELSRCFKEAQRETQNLALLLGAWAPCTFLPCGCTISSTPLLFALPSCPYVQVLYAIWQPQIRGGRSWQGNRAWPRSSLPCSPCLRERKEGAEAEAAEGGGR